LVNSRSKDPRSERRRTYDLIGLKDSDFTPNLAAHPRAQPDKPSLDAGTRAAYASAYNDDVRALIAAFAEIDVTLWPNFAHLA
jgi:hypothetical protein